MLNQIFNAFVFAGIPFDKAVLLLGSKAGVVQALVDNAQVQLLATRLAHLVDQVTLSFVGKPAQTSSHSARLGRSAWSVAQEALLTEQKALRKSFDPNPLVHCDVEFHLFAAYDSRHLMGFSKQGLVDAAGVIRGIAGVQDFAWHSGTPRKGLPQEAWATRGHAWARAMDPATGFSFQQYWSPRVPSAEDVVARLPTTEQRALSIARERMLPLVIAREYAGGSRVPRVRLERELSAQLAEPGSALFEETQQVANGLLGVLHPTERLAHLAFEKMAMLVPEHRDARTTSIPHAAEVAQYESLLHEG